MIVLVYDLSQVYKIVNQNTKALVRIEYNRYDNK